MSSPEPEASPPASPDSPPGPSPGPAGYHVVSVPVAGLAACLRHDDEAAMVGHLKALVAGRSTLQFFAFGPDGRRWPTTRDPAYLATPDGPVYLGPAAPVPAEADPDGLAMPGDDDGGLPDAPPPPAPPAADAAAPHPADAAWDLLDADGEDPFGA